MHVSQKNGQGFGDKNLDQSVFVFRFQHRYFSALLEGVDLSEQLLNEISEPDLQHARRRLQQQTRFLKRLLRIYRKSYSLQQRFKFHKLFFNSVTEVEDLEYLAADVSMAKNFSSDSDSDLNSECSQFITLRND